MCSRKDFGMAHRNVIDQHQMLMNLAHIADVRNDGNVILTRQQADGEKFAHTAQARAVGLQKSDASGLKIVLEDDAVGNMLAQRKREGSDGGGELPMRVNVVGMGRLFDPVRVDAAELAAGNDGGRQRPLLVCVEHDGGGGADETPQSLGALHIALERSTYFELERAEALIEAALHIFANLLVVVVIPADTGVVPRIAAIEHAHAAPAGGLLFAQHAQSGFAVEDIFEIAEIEQVRRRLPA